MNPARKLLASVSLANLALIPSWLELLFRRTSTGYYMKRLPEAADFLAALAALGLVTAVLYGLFTLAERWKPGRWLAGLAVALVLSIPADALRTSLPKDLGFGALQAQGLAAAVIAVVVLGGLGFVLVKNRHRLLEVAVAVVLLASPFAGLNVVRSLYAAATTSENAELTKATPPLATTPVVGHAPGHVVWMIFDELDYRLAFQDRPKGTELPEFDRLRAQSVYATQAIPPAIETRRSLPALLTGRVVEDVEIEGPSALSVQFKGVKEPSYLAEIPTVFNHARARGAETEIVGWYSPYCRVLAANLSRCAWRPVNQTVIGQSASEPFLSRLVSQLEGLSPLSPRQLHIQAYEGLHEDTMAALSPDHRGLQFFHFSVPHTPSIYDAENHEMTVMKWGNVSGYPGNLMLADRLLGDVRKKMEANGTWDGASIVVSGDHPWRQSHSFDGKKDPRVPFLLKLPGQTEAVEYADRFETVRTSRVVLELLTHEKPTPEDARSWMERDEAALATDFLR